MSFLHQSWHHQLSASSEKSTGVSDMLKRAIFKMMDGCFLPHSPHPSPLGVRWMTSSGGVAPAIWNCKNQNNNNKKQRAGGEFGCSEEDGGWKRLSLDSWVEEWKNSPGSAETHFRLQNLHLFKHKPRIWVRVRTPGAHMCLPGSDRGVNEWNRGNGEKHKKTLNSLSHYITGLNFAVPEKH